MATNNQSKSKGSAAKKKPAKLVAVTGSGGTNRIKNMFYGNEPINVFIRRVRCRTSKEAVKMAPFTILKIATQDWKNHGSPLRVVDLKRYCMDALDRVTKMEEGLGLVVCIKPPLKQANPRPKYEVYNNKEYRKTAKRGEGQKCMVFYGDGRRIIRITDYCTKSKAIRTAKLMCRELNLQDEAISCFVEYRAMDKQPVFTLQKVKEERVDTSWYGEYLIFGIISLY